MKEKLVQAMESMQVPEKTKAFDGSKKKNPLFGEHYAPVREVMTKMMVFIRAVHTGNWHIRLESLKAFTKYFFAHDMMHYARMKLSESMSSQYAQDRCLQQTAQCLVYLAAAT